MEFLYIILSAFRQVNYVFLLRRGRLSDLFKATRQFGSFAADGFC